MCAKYEIVLTLVVRSLWTVCCFFFRRWSSFCAVRMRTIDQFVQCNAYTITNDCMNVNGFVIEIEVVWNFLPNLLSAEVEWQQTNEQNKKKHTRLSTVEILSLKQ